MKLLGWRRIASAVWDAPNDPQILGAMELDATPVLAFMDRARAAGHHLTPTHLVGRAVARGLRELPELNVRIAFGRAHLRPSVDIFFITAVEGGHDLSGVKISATDEKSAIEVAEEVARRVGQLRGGQDAEFARTKRLMELLPPRVLRLGLRLVASLTADWGLDLPLLGMHASPFGSAMISSVGMFGLQFGFSPIAWLYRVPLIVVVGQLGQKPVVRKGKIIVGTVLPLCATIDHRYADGYQIGRFVTCVREYLENPFAFEDEQIPKHGEAGASTPPLHPVD